MESKGRYAAVAAKAKVAAKGQGLEVGSDLNPWLPRTG